MRYSQKVVTMISVLGICFIPHGIFSNETLYPSWNLSSLVGYSVISRREHADWIDFYFRAKHTLNAEFTYTLLLDQYYRFDTSDTYLGASFMHKLTDRFEYGSEWGATLDPFFRPVFRMSPYFRYLLTDPQSKINQYVILGNLQYDNFIALDIYTLWLGVEWYRLNSTWLTASTVITMAEDHTDIGWVGSYNWSPTDDFYGFFGLGYAPETTDLATTLSHSIFFGVNSRLSQAIDLRLIYARYDRLNSYLREEYTVKLSIDL
jgi:YaiO family outer membrane protein